MSERNVWASKDKDFYYIFNKKLQNIEFKKKLKSFKMKFCHIKNILSAILFNSSNKK